MRTGQQQSATRGRRRRGSTVASPASAFHAGPRRVPSSVSVSSKLLVIISFLLTFLVANADSSAIIGQPLRFRLKEWRLEVADLAGHFAPLCHESFRREYGDEVCVAAGKGGISWHEFVPLSSLSTNIVLPRSPSPPSALSVACIANTTACLPVPVDGCGRIVRVVCQSSLCRPPSWSVAGRCMRATRRVRGFAAAAAECAPLSARLAAAATPSAQRALLETVHERYNSSRIVFLTAGVRAGSRWQWEDGKEINIQPAGSGRCLGIRHGAWVAVDCDLEEVSPLCESTWECLAETPDGRLVYDGALSVAQTGERCLSWSSPLLPRLNISWPHNFCRPVQSRRRAGCFVAAARFEFCSLPECPKQLRHDDNSITNEETNSCNDGEFSCGAETDECIAREFVCDYEADCVNGADERGCEDYLRNFELVGAFKLVERISEIWTNIPNIQGCARRCASSSLVCEALSYTPRTQLCLLSDSAAAAAAKDVPCAAATAASTLAPRVGSLYYRRRFSTKGLESRWEAKSLLLRIAKKTKEGLSAFSTLCDDGFSREHASAICGIFGFGRSVPPVASSSADTRSWTLQCLRSDGCGQPAQAGCMQLRCTHCPVAACSSDGSCLQLDNICDGIRDCADSSDEAECAEVPLRLAAGADEVRGGLEAQVGGAGIWLPVCADGIDAAFAGAICRSMHMGEPAAILAPHALSSPGGRLLRCSSDEAFGAAPSCSAVARAPCRRQAAIQCRRIPLTSISSESAASSTCGTRAVSFTARDPGKARFARVVGGFEAAAGAFPWTAAIRLRLGAVHHCGATLVHPRFLLTAAHCFEDDRRPRSYEVVVGDWDNNATEGTEQTLPISRIHFYPLYEDLFAHDVAIVELAAPGARLGAFARPACLPPRDFRYSTGRRCVVAGWGSMGLRYATRLQAALVPIIDRATCQNASSIYASMSRSAFCAGYLSGGVDACQGDSGGPLVCQQPDGVFYLAGVISWGDGCAQKNQPGIYTMVAPYLSWINDVLASASEKDLVSNDVTARRRKALVSSGSSDIISG